MAGKVSFAVVNHCMIDNGLAVVRSRSVKGCLMTGRASDEPAVETNKAKKATKVPNCSWLREIGVVL